MSAELPRPEHALCCKIRGCTASSSAGTYRCSSCQEKHRRNNRRVYRERVIEGLCTCCVQKATAGIYCFKHWLKNIGNQKGLANQKGIALLKKLWEEQQGCCAITREVLIPGVNASLDHILPVSRGGRSIKKNLQWVTSNINHAKWDRTTEEFIQICRTVVRVYDQRESAKTLSDKLIANKGVNYVS